MLEGVISRGAWASVLALVAFAAAGCGSDGEDSTAGERLRYSAASEPPETFAERMAKLLETTRTKRDCPQLDRINERSLTRFSCPPSRALSRSMARFEVVGAKEYGTGAVVDYVSGEVKDGAAIVLYAAPDRNWAVSRFGVVTEPSTDTSDERSRAGFRKAVDDYLAAVRERDCEAFMAVAFNKGESSRRVCATTFLATSALQAQLKASPAVKLRYEGGNSVYGFFRLETSLPQPNAKTISVVKATTKSASPYVVLDLAPSPTAEYQRRVIEQLKRNRTTTEPERSPSRKADD